jgi:prephenate dehydrogenase
LGDLETAAPDIIVLALPVDAILDILPRLSSASRSLCAERRPLILDVGSVKAPILAAAAACDCPRFVGGHPMAGVEHSGLAHARADLFRRGRFALCPSGRSRADLARARAFVRGLGATPLVIDAREHDRVVALTSHLPHLVAWALMDVARDEAGSASGRGLPWELAGGSWRDATRVAAADPRAWAPILRHNRGAVLHSLDRLLATLTRLHGGLVADEPVLRRRAWGVDAEALARLARAQRRRRFRP